MSRSSFIRYVDDYVCLDDNEDTCFKSLRNLVKPIELINEGEGTEIQYLNIKVYIDDHKLYTKYFFKETTSLANFNSIVDKEN